MKKWQKVLAVGMLSLGVTSLIQKPTEVLADDSNTVVAAKNVSGWIKESNGWKYYTNQKAATGWLKTGNVWYYFNQNGIMQTGWQKIAGVWYYFNNSGYMQTGWQRISGVWYFFNNNGNMQTGWQKISGVWYFFNNSGYMQTGWQKISGVWYYFNNSGNMKTGWQKISNVWYFFNNSGYMQTGWQKISGAWYYFNGNGSMKTGWLQTTWQKTPNTWYFFNSNGTMKTGWLKQGNNWYFFRNNGTMKQGGEMMVAGQYYRFNGNGVMVSEGKYSYPRLDGLKASQLPILQENFARLLNEYRASKGLPSVKLVSGLNWVSEAIATEKAKDFSDFDVDSKYWLGLAEQNGKLRASDFEKINNVSFTSYPRAVTTLGKEAANLLFDYWTNNESFNEFLLGDFDVFGISDGIGDVYTGHDTIHDGKYIHEQLGINIYALTTAKLK